MSSKYEDATARHQKLIRAARGPIDKEFGAVVKAASIFDLQWFSGRIDEQLEETPHHVTDPEQLQSIMEKTRRQRMIVASALDTIIAIQSRKEKSEVRLWQILGFSGTVLGIIIGAIVCIYF